MCPNEGLFLQYCPKQNTSWTQHVLTVSITNRSAFFFFFFFGTGFCQLVVKQYLNRVNPRLQLPARLQASSYSCPSCLDRKGQFNTFTLKSRAKDVNHCGNDWIGNLIIINVIIWLQTCEALYAVISISLIPSNIS